MLFKVWSYVAQCTVSCYKCWQVKHVRLNWCSREQHINILQIKLFENIFHILHDFTMMIFYTLYITHFVMSDALTYVTPRKTHNSQEITCVSLFLIKLQASSLHFSKKETLTQCFPVNFVKFLRTPFLQNTSRPLFLYSPTYFVNFHVFSWKCFLCLLILRKLFQMQSSLTKIFNFTSSEWYYLFLLQKFICVIIVISEKRLLCRLLEVIH